MPYKVVSRSGTQKNDFSCKKQQTKWRPLQNKLFFCKKIGERAWRHNAKRFKIVQISGFFIKGKKNRTNIFIYVKAILYIFHCVIFLNLKKSYGSYFRSKHESGFFLIILLCISAGLKNPLAPK